ncbi:hypothetical protein HDG37_000226 [Paraburkholderia sp. MM5384-R2]|nr:hypothetical protein [Paraburkholderia sp. MM5384-R2]
MDTLAGDQQLRNRVGQIALRDIEVFKRSRRIEQRGRCMQIRDGRA